MGLNRLDESNSIAYADFALEDQISVAMGGDYMYDYSFNQIDKIN